MSSNIPETQTACIFHEHGGPEKIEYVTSHPVRQQKDLKPGEALVKIEYSGVCHTDMHALKGDWPVQTKAKPVCGGHEGAGHIVAIGDHTITNLKVGDAVGVKWLATSCLDCEICRGGQEACCPKAQCHGYSVDGSFQEYCVSYTNHLTPIPEGIPLEIAAPCLCAGVTMWKAIKQSNTKPGDFILIVGAAGGLGSFGVSYAVAIGLRVIALDTGADKEKFCSELGAEVFVDFKKEGANLVNKIKEVTGELGPHAAIVAAAQAAAYEQALEYLRPTGTLVAVGLPPDTTIKANVFFTVFRSLRVVGSYVGNRQDAIEALDFVRRGMVKPRIKVMPLQDLPKVYEMMEKGTLSGRIVLKV